MNLCKTSYWELSDYPYLNNEKTSCKSRIMGLLKFKMIINMMPEKLKE